MKLDRLAAFMGKNVSERGKRPLRNTILKYRPYVPKELMINPGDVVLQVGCPTERTVSRLASVLGENGRLIIIEPYPATAQGLQAFVGECRKVNWPEISILNQAAGAEASFQELLVSKSMADHRLEGQSIAHDNDYLGYVGSQVVEVVTLDDVAANASLDSLDYVEIAVNGAEVDVLAGGRETLRRTQRIFVKAHARQRDSGEPIRAEIVEILADLGFRTTETRSSRAVDPGWGARQGDVYGWRY